MPRIKRPAPSGAKLRRLRHSVTPSVRTPEVAQTTRVPNVIIIWWEARRLRLPVTLGRLLVEACETIIAADLETGRRDRRQAPIRWAEQTLDGRRIEG